jgi:hypothetical protein
MHSNVGYPTPFFPLKLKFNAIITSLIVKRWFTWFTALMLTPWESQAVEHGFMITLNRFFHHTSRPCDVHPVISQCQLHLLKHMVTFCLIPLHYIKAQIDPSSNFLSSFTGPCLGSEEL